jgi:hypothetical protein
MLIAVNMAHFIHKNSENGLCHTINFLYSIYKNTNKNGKYVNQMNSKKGWSHYITFGTEKAR